MVRKNANADQDEVAKDVAEEQQSAEGSPRNDAGLPDGAGVPNDDGVPDNTGVPNGAGVPNNNGGPDKIGVPDNAEGSDGAEKSKDAASSTSESRFRGAFGFSWNDFRSWKAASTLLYAPRDPAAIAVFRILFGIAMFHDTFSERHMGDLGEVWNKERICHFPLFDFLEPLPLAWMFIIHFFMAVGALCIALGLFFNYAIWLHIIPYWYTFFLDKTTWNNHTYLFGLVSFMLAFTSANHCWSLDAVINPKLKHKHVPLWNYAIFRYQFLIVYFIAGLKKFSDPDWMLGWSMDKLASHWVFAPFTAFLSEATVSFLIVHLGGATLDLLGGWLLFFDKTRPIAIVLVQKFHLMNMQMFSIGMFPIVMLCTTPMFCYPDWPRRIAINVEKLLFAVKLIKEQPIEPETPSLTYNRRCIYDKETVKGEEKRREVEEEEEEKASKRKEMEKKKEEELKPKEVEEKAEEKELKEKETNVDENSAAEASESVLRKRRGDRVVIGRIVANRRGGKSPAKRLPVLKSTPGSTHHCVTACALAWMAWQAFLPYSHFITKGYNGWTEGLYGYSWDMMIKTWSTQHVRVSFKDVTSGEVGYLNPEVITEGHGSRWSSHPDMVKQFAGCVKRKFAEFNVTDFKLHFDVWRSMTNRFQQRMFDPRADLMTAHWSPFSAASWVMPLLSDLTDWRGKLRKIKEERREAAKEEEDLMPNIIFAADFPGLFLENYISPGLDNTTVELMHGQIEVEYLGLDGDDDAEEEEEGVDKPKEPHVLSEEAKRGKNVTLTKPGQSAWLPPGEYHRIHTTGQTPSCYMFIYENTTDQVEFKKERGIKKMWEKMINASRDEPDLARNFSDPVVVANFLPDLPAEHVNKFAENFKNKTEREQEEKTRILSEKSRVMKAGYYFMNKVHRVGRRYGKAMWYFYHATRSLLQGVPLEDLLLQIAKEGAEQADKEREKAEKEKAEKDARDRPDFSMAKDDVVESADS